MTTTSLGTLVVYLTGDGSSYVRAWTMAQSTTKMAGAAIVATLAGIAAASVKAAAQFESSFTGIEKTVDGTIGQLMDLEATMRGMSLDIPVNVNDLNRLGESAGQLGVELKSIPKFVRVMADLNVATNITGEEGAADMARFANIMEMSQDNFDRMGSAITALGNDSAATEREILRMSMRLAGAGKQIGLTEAEVLGLATALSSVGLETEMGGSAFSRVLADMSKAANQGGASLELFARIAGRSAQDFAKFFHEDASGALVEFVEGLDRAGDSGVNLFGVLSQLSLDEIRVRDALLRTAGAGGLLRKELDLGNKAWKDNTALTKEAERRYKTFASQMTLLKNAFNDVMITLGDDLIPVIRSFLEGLGVTTFVVADLKNKLAAGTIGMAEYEKGMKQAEEGQAEFQRSVRDISAAFTTGWITAIGAATDAVYGWRLAILAGQMVMIKMAQVFRTIQLAGTTAFLGIGATIEQAMRGGERLIIVSLYTIRSKFTELLRWARQVQIDAANMLNEILPTQKSGEKFFGKDYLLPLHKDVVKLSAELNQLEKDKANALEGTTNVNLDAFKKSWDELTVHQHEVKKNADEYSMAIANIRAEFDKLAASGRPSEKLLADTLAKMQAEMDKIRNADKGGVTPTVNTKGLQDLEGVFLRVTPALDEFRAMTRDPLGNAMIEYVNKFNLALDEMKAQMFEAGSQPEDLQNFLLEYEQAVRNAVSQQNEFVAPVAGIQEMTGIQGLDEGIQQDNELKLMEASYQAKIQAQRDYLATLRDDQVEARQVQLALIEESERRYGERLAAFNRQRLMMNLAGAQAVFDQLSGIVAAGFGEQTGAYKAMFAISKAFAIAQATIAMYAAMAEASRLGWPAGIFAALQAAAHGASIIANVQAVALSFEGGGLTPKGPRSGGLDGKGGFPAILHPNEQIIDLTKEKYHDTESITRSVSETAAYVQTPARAAAYLLAPAQEQAAPSVTLASVNHVVERESSIAETTNRLTQAVERNVAPLSPVIGINTPVSATERLISQTSAHIQSLQQTLERDTQSVTQNSASATRDTSRIVRESRQAAESTQQTYQRLVSTLSTTQEIAREVVSSQVSSNQKVIDFARLQSEISAVTQTAREVEHLATSQSVSKIERLSESQDLERVTALLDSREVEQVTSLTDTNQLDWVSSRLEEKDSLVEQTHLRSFMGGGLTGSGPRSGGLDGHGGFTAILHPQERVVDLRESNSQYDENSNITVNVYQTFTGGVTREDLGRFGQQVKKDAINGTLDGIQRGGAMRRAAQT